MLFLSTFHIVCFASFWYCSLRWSKGVRCWVIFSYEAIPQLLFVKPSLPTNVLPALGSSVESSCLLLPLFWPSLSAVPQSLSFPVDAESDVAFDILFQYLAFAFRSLDWWGTAPIVFIFIFIFFWAIRLLWVGCLVSSCRLFWSFICILILLACA